MTTDPSTTTASSRTASAQRGGRRRAATTRAKAKPAADPTQTKKSPIDGDFIASHKLALAVVVVIVVTAVALYGPLRAYYVAWRTNEVQTAALESVNANNDQLKGQIQSLMTPEGIKDEARKRGYVDEGESSVVVKGFTDEGDANAGTATEDPWYVAVLDSIFGFEGV